MNQNFARYGIGGEISTTILVFILDYFQEKLMTKFFKKSKQSNLGVISGPFCPNLGKNEFPWKKGLQFKYSNYLTSSQKLEKTNKPFLRKMPNSWSDRRTGGQTILWDPPWDGGPKINAVEIVFNKVWIFSGVSDYWKIHSSGILAPS